MADLLTPLEAEDITKPGAFAAAADMKSQGAVRIFGSEDGSFTDSVTGNLENPDIVKPAGRPLDGSPNAMDSFDDGSGFFDQIGEVGEGLTRAFADASAETFNQISTGVNATINAPGAVINSIEESNRIVVALGFLALVYVMTRK